MLEWNFKPEYLEAIVGAVAIAAAIVLALYVSPWVNARQTENDKKERILRDLLIYRQTPANPAWQAAMSLIPLDFQGDLKVMAAFNKYLRHISVDVRSMPPEVRDPHLEAANELQRQMIATIAKQLNFQSITVDTLVGLAYTSQGYVEREELIKKSLEAWQGIYRALSLTNMQTNFILTRNYPDAWPPREVTPDQASSGRDSAIGQNE